MKARTCGKCQACCYGIHTWATRPPLNSPAHERCPYQCRQGCAIYDERPQPCRDYLCLWLSGELGERRDRPDRLGLIFERTPEGVGPALIVTEVRPGAADAKRARAIIEEAAGMLPVCVLRFQGKRAEFYGEVETFLQLQSRARQLGVVVPARGGQA